MLYVGGRGGVYRSFDKGQSWQLFPDETIDEAAVSGGLLPNLTVSDIEHYGPGIVVEYGSPGKFRMLLWVE